MNAADRDKILWGVGALGCLGLIAGAATRNLPISWPEALGFATGLWCVVLVMRNNVWNFPIGLLNNIFFIVLFHESRLFNDMTLQGVYFVFGVAGWYSWVYGGKERTPLPITRATPVTLASTIVAIAAATPVLMRVSQFFSGAAPFWDALTTAISLGAQFLLNGKRIQHWWFWIVADALYVPLYISRGLYLTAALFALFLMICIAGLRSWQQEIRDVHTEQVSPQTWPFGLVIGKFYPPHRGHRLLIETALSRVENLTIVICGRPGETPESALRAEWLRELFPQARVMLLNDIYYGHDDDSQFWARLTRSWFGRSPDVVFTSEHYGQNYTKFLECDHVEVDLSRVQVPISGTKVRADPLGNWEFLDAPVRGYYAKRVAVLGAESTGSTTLAQDLAERFSTIWVPEYGREYCEQFWTGDDYQWRSSEFAWIAAEQLRRENEAARACNGLVICDTDAFATRLWHRRYIGHFSPAVDAIAASHRPDLYLLTGDEIPFVQDGIRDGEHIRHEMHTHFEEELGAGNVPWHLIRGTREERLEQATRLVEKLIKQPKAT